ncbi:hypothetical protein BJ986_000049 [Phycicoccus badiiscoriae]|uniref:Uncharacterized protein n=1 Tax=Pedococcus badiiscoriae TaxID=642776 RepID=A0A852WJS1_9MICO|nr:hypothetical protein [Pedococcus badiiscoriae]NYG05562.1 hypothetical protein [Pedococcus badiiscoriae]
MTRPRPGGILDRAFWVATAAAVVWLMVGVGGDLGPAWDAAHGRGQRGTLTVQRSACGRTTCTYTGSFTSFDGTVRLPEADVAEFLVTLDRGQRVAVVRPPSGGTRLYLARGSRAWVVDTVLLVVCGLAVATMAWLVLVKRRLRLALPAAHRPTGMDRTRPGAKPRQAKPRRRQSRRP